MVSRVYSTTRKEKYLTLGEENSEELKEIVPGAHSGLLKVPLSGKLHISTVGGNAS